MAIFVWWILVGKKETRTIQGPYDSISNHLVTITNTFATSCNLPKSC